MNVLSKEDLDPLEQLALFKLSYSRMNTYDMCAAKYFYSYILDEEQVFGPAASLGNVLHSVLEDHVGEELKMPDMLESMDKYRREYDPDKLIDNDLLDAGENMLGEFVDRHKDEEFEIIGKELAFEIVIGSALVRGFIDLVVRAPDGSIHVIDYKSGKFEVSKKDVPDNLQLGIYALAVKNLFPEEDSIYAELYYLRSGRRKGHLFKADDLESVYDRVLDKVNEIIEDRHFKVVNDKTFVCSFCDFRKTGVCKTGVMRYGKD